MDADNDTTCRDLLVALLPADYLPLDDVLRVYVPCVLEDGGSLSSGSMRPDSDCTTFSTDPALDTLLRFLKSRFLKFARTRPAARAAGSSGAEKAAAIEEIDAVIAIIWPQTRAMWTPRRASSSSMTASPRRSPLFRRTSRRPPPPSTPPTSHPRREALLPRPLRQSQPPPSVVRTIRRSSRPSRHRKGTSWSTHFWTDAYGTIHARHYTYEASIMQAEVGGALRALTPPSVRDLVKRLTKYPIPDAAFDIQADKAAMTLDMRVPYQQLKYKHVTAGASCMRNEYLRCMPALHAFRTSIKASVGREVRFDKMHAYNADIEAARLEAPADIKWPEQDGHHGIPADSQRAARIAREESFAEAVGAFVLTAVERVLGVSFDPSTCSTDTNPVVTDFLAELFLDHDPTVAEVATVSEDAVAKARSMLHLPTRWKGAGFRRMASVRDAAFIGCMHDILPSYAAVVREALGRPQAATFGHLIDADARVMKREAKAEAGSHKDLTTFLDHANNSLLQNEVCTLPITCRERLLFGKLDAESGMWTVAIPTARTVVTPYAELR
eukprot:jgi/Tetstr1/433129/TSEL_022461.t1